MIIGAENSQRDHDPQTGSSCCFSAFFPKLSRFRERIDVRDGSEQITADYGHLLNTPSRENSPNGAFKVSWKNRKIQS